MKIAVFGGTGRTGRRLVEQALAEGYQVAVLARTPGKLEIQNPALTVIEGDVKDAGAVERTIAGAEAVLSTLGPSSNAPVFEVSQGMGNILAAMKSQGVRRLVISAGAGVGSPDDALGLFHRGMNFLLKLMAKNVLADMTQAVEMVRNSDLDWTVVRLPMLADGPRTGNVRAGYLGKGVGARITRADVAGFMLAQIKDSSYLRKSPVISN